MLDVDRNALIAIDDELHRVIARLGRQVLLTHVANGRIFLMQHECGAIGLPSVDDVLELEAGGRAAAITASPASATATDAARLELELSMLDGARVANGSKAIFLFLNANWSRELIDRYGDHDHPDTLKRIRTARRRARGA